MKTNEAPEKIYLERILCSNEVYDTWKSQKTISDDIEYIRKDAFIEKAEKYLKNQFIKDVSILAGGVANINFSTAIRNFVNYMKGE